MWNQRSKYHWVHETGKAQISATRNGGQWMFSLWLRKDDGWSCDCIEMDSQAVKDRAGEVLGAK